MGQAVSENKTFKDFIHVYSPEARADNPGGKYLIVTKRVCFFNHTM